MSPEAYKELGKYLMDISKGTVLVGIVYPLLKGKFDYNTILAFRVGVLLSVVGLYWISKGGSRS